MLSKRGRAIFGPLEITTLSLPVGLGEPWTALHKGSMISGENDVSLFVIYLFTKPQTKKDFYSKYE